MTRTEFDTDSFIPKTLMEFILLQRVRELERELAIATEGRVSVHEVTPAPELEMDIGADQVVLHKMAHCRVTPVQGERYQLFVTARGERGNYNVDYFVSSPRTMSDRDRLDAAVSLHNRVLRRFLQLGSPVVPL